MRKHIVLLSESVNDPQLIIDNISEYDSVYNSINTEPLNLSTHKSKYLNRCLMQQETHWYNDHIRTYIKSAEKENKILVICITRSHLAQMKFHPVRAIETLQHKFDFIRIRRDNYLAMAFDAEANTHYLHESIQLSEDISFVPATSIYIQPKATLRQIKQIEHNESIMDDALLNKYVVDIDYDKMCVDLSNAMDSIATVLGLAGKTKLQFESLGSKWTGILLKDKIINFDEIVMELKGTKYEWMLYE